MESILVKLACVVVLAPVAVVMVAIIIAIILSLLAAIGIIPKRKGS